MEKEADDILQLCKNFCTYYKPGKKKDLACEGFKVVRRLLQEARPISLAKRGAGRAQAPSADALREVMCINCAFSEADCDYIATGGKALPCGGFVFLRHLLDEERITKEEIKHRSVKDHARSERE